MTSLVGVSIQERTLTFLVVDDNEDVRDVFTQLIERSGHVAAVAADGVEALEALQSQTFDVMLLDVTMPRMSGIQVARFLHENPDVAPDTRVVVISAWAGEHRAVLQELGVETVMQKPLRLKQLTALIDETLFSVDP